MSNNSTAIWTMFYYLFHTFLQLMCLFNIDEYKGIYP